MTLTKLIILDFLGKVKGKICNGISMYAINKNCIYLEESKIKDRTPTKTKNLYKKYVGKSNGGKARNAI